MFNTAHELDVCQTGSAQQTPSNPSRNPSEVIEFSFENLAQPTATTRAPALSVPRDLNTLASRYVLTSSQGGVVPFRIPARQVRPQPRILPVVEGEIAVRPAPDDCIRTVGSNGQLAVMCIRRQERRANLQRGFWLRRPLRASCGFSHLFYHKKLLCFGTPADTASKRHSGSLFSTPPTAFSYQFFSFRPLRFQIRANKQVFQQQRIRKKRARPTCSRKRAANRRPSWPAPPPPVSTRSRSRCSRAAPC